MNSEEREKGEGRREKGKGKREKRPCGFGGGGLRGMGFGARGVPLIGVYFVIVRI
jgi:hypothetical protein